MAKLSMHAGLAAALLLLAPIAPHAAPAPVAATDVAWLPAAADADVDRAFAQARGQGKPLLLYWGAKWCPPCNQLKATLFNRQDFIERSQAFVTVSIDGDSPGAQKLGARFKVRGYPTMILFNPQGQELTRLPGEIDAPQVVSLMQLGLANGRPIQAVLADVNAGKRLGANEWRLLAFYAWDTDEQQLVPDAERPALLLRLAQASPAGDPETSTRLWLRALAENADGKGLRPDAALRERIRRLLADPAASRAQMDLLTNAAPEIVKALAGGDAAQRKSLAQAFDSALQRLQADTSLSRADRVTALLARVELARGLAGAADSARTVRLPAALLKEARDTAAREDREITDGYERQAVIGTAAHVLARAGLWDESDALLKANLPKSHSPYYLMSSLARHAQARGDKAGALRWYREAYDKSEGGATRLQWGANYVSALVDLAPQDVAAIEQAAQRLIGEAAAQPHAFYERSAQALQRAGGKLQAWNAGNRHRDTMRRLQAQLQGACGKLDAADPQRATCEGLLKPALAKAG